jgi:hypothetical protein
VLAHRGLCPRALQLKKNYLIWDVLRTQLGEPQTGILLFVNAFRKFRHLCRNILFFRKIDKRIYEDR